MKKGLTLAEVLLGMVILTFVLIAILALFANCIILNESNRNLTIALSHAQFVMEEIRGEAEDKTTLKSLRDEIDGGVTWYWDEKDKFPNKQKLSNERIITCCYDSANAKWCGPSGCGCPDVCNCPDEDPMRIRVTSEYEPRRGSAEKRYIVLETLITVP